MVFNSKSLSYALLLFVVFVHCRSLEDPLNQATSSPTSNPHCTLTINPDITGIGVRVAFYLQGFITILGPMYFNAEEKESALRNAFFTSVALTLSTIIYGRTPGGLSIVDGLIVTFLPYTISTGAENNTLALIQGKATLKFAYILHLAFCAAFGLLVWVNVDTYGTTPGCNLNSSAKFVVFGHSVGATSKGLRGFGIFAFALTAVVLPLAVLRLAVLQRPAVGDGGDHNGDHEDDTGYSTFLGWFWTIFLLSIWVYEVVTIEEILRRNALDYATHQWSFGQTLALTMVLSPAFDFASAVLRSL